MPRQPRASGTISRGHQTRPSMKAARSHSPATSESFEDEQHVSVDYSRLTREKLSLLRGKNQFKLQKNSTDPRFYTSVQLDLYNSLYKDAKFLCSYIKWDYIGSHRCLDGIRKNFELIGIDRLVSEPYNWDEEVIRQFYATVYVCPHNRSITWMTDGSVCKVTKKQFADAIGVPTGGDLPKLDSSEDHEHIDKGSYYEEDGICGKTIGLSALAYGTNNIMRKTIFPVDTKTNISESSWLVLDHLCKGTKFDVADLLICEIESQICDPKRKILYYAAYIMKLISNKCKYKGSTGFVHQLYSPEGDKKKNKLNRHRQKAEAANAEGDHGENGELRQLQPERHDDPLQQQILAMLTARSCMLDEQKMIWLDMIPKIEKWISSMESGQARIEEQLSKFRSSAASYYGKGYACTGLGDGAAQYCLQQAVASTDDLERDIENRKPPQKPQGQPQHNQFQQQVAQCCLHQAAASTVEGDKENGKPPQKPQGQPQYNLLQQQALDMLTAQSHNLDEQKLISTIVSRLSSVLTRQEHLLQLIRDLMTSAGRFYSRAYSRKGRDCNERSLSGIASMEVDDPS